MTYFFGTESLCDVVKRIKLQLEAAGVSCHPQHLPGANRLQSDVTAIADSGAVILVITNNPSPYYQQVVGLCVNAKHKTDKTIIPVFSGVTRDKADNLLETPAYMPLVLIQHVLHEEPGAIERVISCIKEPAICEYSDIKEPAICEYSDIKEPAICEYSDIKDPAICEYSEDFSPS